MPSSISRQLSGAKNSRFAVLATCFNRREVTLLGLRALKAAFGHLSYQVYLVDDGSVDGTRGAVMSEFPNVRLIDGDGSLFWNGGMRCAWMAALADRPDYYFWWNDDLELLPGSVMELFNQQIACEAKYGTKVITVGKIVDPESRTVTYGAYVRASNISRLRFRRVSAEERCVTMNGNCVLVPATAVHDVGILSDRYRHSSGDIDYGLRATRCGYRIFESHNIVGLSSANKTAYSNRDFKAALRDFRRVTSHPKAVPLGEWLYFCRSHGGWLWPMNFVWRYMRIFNLVK